MVNRGLPIQGDNKDGHYTAVEHAKFARGALGEVDDPASYIRAAVVDDDFHLLAGIKAGNKHSRAEWQAGVSRCQRVLVEGFATCSGSPLKSVAIEGSFTPLADVVRIVGKGSR